MGAYPSARCFSRDHPNSVGVTRPHAHILLTARSWARLGTQRTPAVAALINCQCQTGRCVIAARRRCIANIHWPTRIQSRR
ncbi:hypothetical protein OH77DRAFT_356556 [Trametes cingulata]|nr:hypothetical protein OH77DRAFT_356556 [Trametes cingulata]